MVRNANDFYPTPPLIIRAVIKNVVPFSKSIPVWEPCCGDGRFVDAIKQMGVNVIQGDVVTGEDFFEITQAPAKFLITNPPFGKIRNFIDHAFTIGVERMALVCPERLWACKKGYDQWQRHRPTVWANLDWREDYLQKGGSPDRALAVGIWEKPHSDTCSYQIWDKFDT
jgi:hypothetical protein